MVFNQLTDGQIVAGIGVAAVLLVLSAIFFAWVDLMLPVWKVKLTVWRMNVAMRGAFDSIYLISAGRLCPVVLTTLIVVEGAFVFASFYSQNPTLIIIIHHAYVVVALSWLAYAAYTIKTLERSVRRKG